MNDKKFDIGVLDGIVEATITGSLGAEEISSLMASITTLLESQPKRLLMINVAKNNTMFLDKDARAGLKNGNFQSTFKEAKIALVGLTPPARMLSRIALNLVGRSKDWDSDSINVKCKTREEARAWLKGTK